VFIARASLYAALASCQLPPEEFKQFTSISQVQTKGLKKMFHETIKETISANDIVIIARETGSGKITQIPQFLYEAGYAAKKMIGIT
jgi:HrpA-like RNA helicase